MPTTKKIPDGRPYRVRFFGSPFPGKMDDAYYATAKEACDSALGSAFDGCQRIVVNNLARKTLLLETRGTRFVRTTCTDVSDPDYKAVQQAITMLAPE